MTLTVGQTLLDEVMEIDPQEPGALDTLLEVATKIGRTAPIEDNQAQISQALELQFGQIFSDDEEKKQLTSDVITATQAHLERQRKRYPAT